MVENDKRLIELIKQHISGKKDNSEAICDIVYDEVYLLVRPVYDTKKQAGKAADQVMARILTKLDKIDLANPRVSIARNASVYLYQIYADKYGRLFMSDGNSSDAEYAFESVNDDRELLPSVKKYNKMLGDVDKMDMMSEVFGGLTVGQVILYELFCYENTPVAEITELLNVEEDVILKELYKMRKGINILPAKTRNAAIKVDQAVNAARGKNSPDSSRQHGAGAAAGASQGAAAKGGYDDDDGIEIEDDSIDIEEVDEEAYDAYLAEKKAGKGNTANKKIIRILSIAGPLIAVVLLVVILLVQVLGKNNKKADNNITTEETVEQTTEEKTTYSNKNKTTEKETEKTTQSQTTKKTEATTQAATKKQKETQKETTASNKKNNSNKNDSDEKTDSNNKSDEKNNDSDENIQDQDSNKDNNNQDSGSGDKGDSSDNKDDQKSDDTSNSDSNQGQNSQEGE